MTETSDELTSLSEAAAYAHTCRQAIFSAIQKGRLRAEKRRVKNCRDRWLTQWVIKKVDLDEYRRSKYSREKRLFQGERLFDLDQDRLSVLHSSKILSEALGRSYPAARLYYLLRTGRARGFKRASAWIIRKEELLRIYHMETGSANQLEFVQ